MQQSEHMTAKIGASGTYTNNCDAALKNRSGNREQGGILGLQHTSEIGTTSMVCVAKARRNVYMGRRDESTVPSQRKYIPVLIIVMNKGGKDVLIIILSETHHGVIHLRVVNICKASHEEKARVECRYILAYAGLSETGCGEKVEVVGAYL